MISWLHCAARNTRWYAVYWAQTGEIHPQEHHAIGSRLIEFRKAWGQMTEAQKFEVLDACPPEEPSSS